MDILLTRYKQTGNLFKHCFPAILGFCRAVRPESLTGLNRWKPVIQFSCPFSFSGSRNQFFCFIEGFEKIVFFPFWPSSRKFYLFQSIRMPLKLLWDSELPAKCLPVFRLSESGPFQGLLQASWSAECSSGDLQSFLANTWDGSGSFPVDAADHILHREEAFLFRNRAAYVGGSRFLAILYFGFPRGYWYRTTSAASSTQALWAFMRLGGPGDIQGARSFATVCISSSIASAAFYSCLFHIIYASSSYILCALVLSLGIFMGYGRICPAWYVFEWLCQYGRTNFGSLPGLVCLP